MRKRAWVLKAVLVVEVGVAVAVRLRPLVYRAVYALYVYCLKKVCRIKYSQFVEEYDEQVRAVGLAA